MSDEMAVGDNASGEEAKANGQEAVEASAAAVEEPIAEPPTAPEAPQVEQSAPETEAAPEAPEIKQEVVETPEIKKEVPDPPEEPAESAEPVAPVEPLTFSVRAIKRRASSVFSDTEDAEDFKGFIDRCSPEEEFKGFDNVAEKDLSTDYSKVVERLEAEVTALTGTYTPVKVISAPAPLRASKRPRTDTDGSRPSSSMSMRSDGDGVFSTDRPESGGHSDSTEFLMPDSTVGVKLERVNPHQVSTVPGATELTSAQATSAASSPAHRGRRATTEMSSPLLRVPLERGWKRELVYRAQLDQHQKRNADIYYYTPKGKKLRSTREVSEHLAGTGLTLDNFSFFKEPVGVDDPEKEIIRDAKLMRRVESPVSSPATSMLEGKRTPKPKPPKGASPEPGATKATPAKIKVKSMGSRLSGSGPSTPGKALKKPATPADNNNSAAWKKPRQPPPAPPAPPPAPPLYVEVPVVAPPGQVEVPLVAPPGQVEVPVVALPGQVDVAPPRPPAVPPPPLQLRPQPQTTPDIKSPRQLVQPCSMTCGRGVPSLSCDACLCLYHPACAGLAAHTDTFFCKNCRKSSSPTPEPPPLTHKSGVSTRRPRDAPRDPPPKQPDRVLLRMKVAGGGPDGERVWAVAKPQPSVPKSQPPIPKPLPPVPKPQVPTPKPQVPTPKPQAPTPKPQAPVPKPQVPVSKPQAPIPKPQPVPKPQVTPKPQLIPQAPPKPQLTPQVPPKPQLIPRPPPSASPRAPALRPSLPQSLAVINGRRFIIVPRNMVQPPAQHEEKRTRGRVSNGVSPPELLSPRRRGRARPDDIDHFTTFYTRAKEHKYSVVTQIFQYLGMRDLAHSARVCRLWREMAATPALWRHVRMKNSHVSDWLGLCAALKRHGTTRLDLRKMLLPQNDTVFWQLFAEYIPTVDTLERIEMCRCPASAVEAVCRGLPALRSLSALAIRDALLDPGPLAALPRLTELRLKSMAGLSLTRDLRPLAELTGLQHLSLTSIKELGWCASDIIGQLENLESLELGECTFQAEFAGVLRRLKRLRRLRLERGTAQCAAPQLLRALATLPLLTRLELVNIDVKIGFDDALAECTNIQRLLIIPTYVSQSATTNKQVLSGVLRLKDTLTHLMWGVTIELLRVTELFIDQCELAGDKAPRDLGECIPVLKPVPGCRPPHHQGVQGPPQVEILPLPTLQRLLSVQLPNTKLKLLRIPFHATWRQSLADFQ